MIAVDLYIDGKKVIKVTKMSNYFEIMDVCAMLFYVGRVNMDCTKNENRNEFVFAHLHFDKSGGTL